MIQLAVLELNLQNSSPTVLFTTDIEIDSHHFDIDITWRGEIDFHSLCPSCFRSPFPLPALHHCPVLQMPEKAQKHFPTHTRRQLTLTLALAESQDA